MNPTLVDHGGLGTHQHAKLRTGSSDGWGSRRAVLHRFAMIAQDVVCETLWVRRQFPETGVSPQCSENACVADISVMVEIGREKGTMKRVRSTDDRILT